MNEDILNRVTLIARDIFDDEALELTPTTTSEDVAEWDSTNHVRLMMALEAEFGIRFETDEITQPKNVGELIALVESKLVNK